MIGTIRKHSSWLWYIIAGLTIVSFVVFMGSGPSRNGGDRRAGSGYGTLYGKPVTAEDFSRAQREFYLYYWLHYGSFPGQNGSLKREDMEREIYIRLLLEQKAKALGVSIAPDSLAASANDVLRSLGQGGQAVPLDQFVAKILTHEGLTLVDFQNFLRGDLAIQQLIATLGLAGSFVTPQEAGQLYDREHQEVSAQAVFFPASNYLAKVSLAPAAITDFYQKNMATYREPDQVQVSYVSFEVSNYLAQAKSELTRSNRLETDVDAAYLQYGQTEFPGETPEKAKAKIRDLLTERHAGELAKTAANELAKTVFAQEPVKAENLAAVAKQKGLPVRVTAPFNAVEGPEDYSIPQAFTKAAFKLTADDPLAGPVSGSQAIYIIALAGKIPSHIPTLDQIHTRVTQDFQNRSAAELAQTAGTNFSFTVAVQLAVGKTFAQAALAAGQAPVALSPFSLSSQEVPEAAGRADIRLLKQAAFTTPIGRPSQFVPTADGGFVLLPQSLLPVDAAKKNTELSQFLGQIRRGRQNEAFNLWLQAEANRELRNTPVYAALSGKGAAH